MKYSATKKPDLSLVLCSKILSYLLVFIIANLPYLWWLNFKVFLPSLSAISINNTGVGGMGGGVVRGGVGGEGGGKNHCLGHHMSGHDAHKVANNTPVGHIVSGRKYRSPLANWHPPWVPLFQPRLRRVGKIPFRKVDQLTFNT